MEQHEYRKLTDGEMRILEKLLSPSFPGRDELLDQATHCEAQETGDPDNYGSIRLRTTSSRRADVDRRVPVEEIVKGDGSPLNAQLDPERLEVRVN